MENPVYPCTGCTVRKSSYCKKCPRWRAWYLYRQSLINGYANKITEYTNKADRYWIYHLPLHRVPIKKSKEETNGLRNASVW